MSLLSIQEIVNAQHDTDVDVQRVDAKSFVNIATSAQTTVKSGAGILGAIQFNANNTSAIRLYDNTVSGGTTIATIPASVGAGSLFIYNLKLNNGLTLSSGSSDTNITLTYL